MAGPLDPDSIERRSFRRVLRGYDTDEVDAFLKEVTGLLRESVSRYDALHDRLLELGNRDMTSEFDQVSQDVGRILQEARAAAEGLRKRAAADAEELSKEAEEAAFELRSDAWIAAEKLLQDATREASSIVQAGERDSLAVIGEAEREAHRRQSAARQESEETVRAAKLEAERVLMDARARSDELIIEASRNVDAAEARAAAVEERRAEMLNELENARQTIGNLEQEIERRREALAGPSPEEVESSTVKLLKTSDQEPPEEDGNVWSEGHEVVRIVRPPKRIVEPPPEPVDAEAMAAEVARLRAPVSEPGEDASVLEAELGEDASALEAEPAPSDPGDVPTEQPEAPQVTAASPPSEIDDLFARLRTIAEPAPDVQSSPGEPVEEIQVEEPSAAPPAPASSPGGPDVFDLRDRLLLPVTNRVLRSVKRELTEAQNIALEELRLEEGNWNPVAASLQERLHEPIETLLTESYAAGVEAAGELTGAEASGAEGRQGDAGESAGELSEALTKAVADVLEEARRDGQGPRQLAAGLSRVYRSWRTDEAERRVRDVAAGAYHRGLLDGSRSAGVDVVRWEVSKRGCPVCREAAEAGEVPIGTPFEEGVTEPPAHPECGCTVVPVGVPED